MENVLYMIGYSQSQILLQSVSHLYTLQRYHKEKQTKNLLTPKDKLGAFGVYTFRYRVLRPKPIRSIFLNLSSFERT